MRHTSNKESELSFEERLRKEETDLEKAAVEFFDHVHESDPNQQAMPLFHIVDGKWRAHVIGAALGAPPDKGAIADFVKQYCKKAGAVLVMFASEIWYRTATPGEKDPLADGVADHPDRQEGFMVSLDSALGHRMILFPMIRDESGCRLGERQEMPSGTRAEGRFTDFVRTTDA